MATKHGKDEVLAPPLARATGLRSVPPPAFDTDRLGSFDGRVSRGGTIRETAIRKARLGARIAGVEAAVASEGAYGPHPTIPFARGGLEWVAFVDLPRDLVVTEHRVIHRPVFVDERVSPDTDLDGVLDRARFPSHALMVGIGGEGAEIRWIGKGIRDALELERAVERAFDDRPAGERGGTIRLVSDMRADRNPTRMKHIAELGHDLAARLERRCPACETPGFGFAELLRGLDCEGCGRATPLVRGELHACVRCDHVEERPRADGLIAADPSSCPRCHP